MSWGWDQDPWQEDDYYSNTKFSIAFDSNEDWDTK